MAFENRITVNIPPDELAKFGPLIPGRVALPTSQHPNDGINGFFLLDTGASQFSIDQTVADELGLTSGRTVTSHGLGGAVPTKTYQVKIYIPAKPLGSQYPPNAVSVLAFQTEVGSLDIHRYHEGLGNLQKRIIGVIGRTLLQFTRTLYDGLTGTIIIETDSAMRNPKPMH
jgi:Aspartyl protease